MIPVKTSPWKPRVLVLDNQANLAESDVIYTKTLMNDGQEEYRDKQVKEAWRTRINISQILILGGGDGALMCELLKKEPAKVGVKGRAYSWRGT